MPSVQLSLVKWFAVMENSGNDDYVENYVLRCNIPSEYGKFLVERTLKDDRKIKVQIVPSEIRNKIKNSRFRFYQILSKYRVYKTKFDKIVDPENVSYLEAKLEFLIQLTTYLTAW